jgi:hypothetical protein
LQSNQNICCAQLLFPQLSRGELHFAVRKEILKCVPEMVVLTQQ